MLLKAICLLALTFTVIVPGDPLTTIRVKHDDFFVDNLGNIYLIKDEELTKYLPTGKKFAAYSNLRLGRISSIDVTNPLKILVYYRDFQQIIFLDNQLSVNSDAVSLEKLELQQTHLVAASSNNSFWIYDKLNNELIRFNENSKRTGSTGNLKQILNTDLNPLHMKEYNGHLYLNDPEQGIFVFDLFCTFNRLVPLKGVSDFSVEDMQVYYRKESLICNYHQRTFEEECRPLSFMPARFKLAQKKMYYGFRDSVVVKNCE
jgi:hypothetical protein